MGAILERLENADSELAVQKKQEKEEILHIPLNKLKLNPNRVRRRINREDIWHMAKNIKSFGILQPLEINKQNEVVLGNRRFEAAKLASLDKVSCIIRESSETYEIEKQLVSDLHTKHLTVLERAIAFKKLIELKGMTKYSLANYLGLSHNLVCRTLALLEANENTLRLMKESKISQRKVAMIMYRLKDKSLEDFVVNEIIEKSMNIVQAGNFIAEINDPDIFKKHFMQRIRGFKTSLKNFKEKLKLLNLDEYQKEEIIDELRSIDFKEIF
jgi:ParB family chromosome partitioning protein